MILRQYLHTDPVIATSYLFGCGRGLSGKPSSTIGFERRFNRAFSLSDEESFVRLMLHEIPPRPERTEEIRAANLGLPLPVEA